MKAVVFHDVGDIRLDNVEDPKIQEPTDAIVRLTSSAICGTDLHMVRGTLAGMVPGTILGHEAVGVVEEVGSQVRNLNVGDRVVIPSTIGCGYCMFCRNGFYAQCDNANPNGPQAGTAFYGGPQPTGPFDGLQAEYARIAYANVMPVKLPENVTDEQAIMISDIFPTAYFGADIAEVEDGDTVAVFGCGPVGQFSIASAWLMGAGRVIAVDKDQSRLEMARAQGAEVINFDEEEPVQTIMELTGNIGVDRVIEAVGVDAQRAHSGPAAEEGEQMEGEFQTELNRVAPETNPQGDTWVPGDAPSQSLLWAAQSVMKAGVIGVIGVFPPQAMTFPIGTLQQRNLTVRGGNCNHRKYMPKLVGLVATGALDPTDILTQTEPITGAIEAYEAFDRRQPGWIKVELNPAA
ncbi:MAG: Threonine dehydrogenase and related Zn-dependent dehydrogenases [uncultured Rubrobacteraceae bacterium]|uniref:Threonine dehydrogenase and related Zn-dependent dehydrogenases n=1 Tax=uncultured Rubrobacteraceae bacterium TaxID=349277 RepID=A0A6J4R788_9ACTN|nr:MAG: Threonine dehydrogenase and related Zn-dependent dehydrogenases [uncultured Rubrobacteraceae bacterium]